MSRGVAIAAASLQSPCSFIPHARRLNALGAAHDQAGKAMNAYIRWTVATVTAFAVLGLTGCAGMSEREKGTAIGAGVGAVGGAVLTGGSALGTAGGAAVGGIIGNQVKKPK